MFLSSFDSLPTECHLLITFANNLDPVQARQNVGPNLGPNCLTLMVFLKEFFERVDFEKNLQMAKKHKKLPMGQRVKVLCCKLYSSSLPLVFRV